MGLPIVELPFMCNLAVDVHTAVKMLLGMGEFQYLADRFSDRRNPEEAKLITWLAMVPSQDLAKVW